MQVYVLLTNTHEEQCVLEQLLHYELIVIVPIGQEYKQAP
jgi:hypothetical protein